MGEIGRLIEDYRDRIGYTISDSQIAEKLGVTRQTVGNWTKGHTPKPANLSDLARLLDVSYTRLLDAMLTDAGYLPREQVTGNAQHPAPKTDAVVRRKTSKRSDRQSPLPSGHPQQPPGQEATGRR
jgi:transcriptional regulator with XRE-family HTH domain